MIGKIIKFMRFRRGMKQIELSRKLGVVQTTLSGYETHYSNPDFDLILRIARLCDFDIVFVDKIENKNYTVEDITKNYL